MIKIPDTNPPMASTGTRMRVGHVQGTCTRLYFKVWLAATTPLWLLNQNRLQHPLAYLMLSSRLVNRPASASFIPLPTLPISPCPLVPPKLRSPLDQAVVIMASLSPFQSCLTQLPSCPQGTWQPREVSQAEMGQSS